MSRLLQKILFLVILGIIKVVFSQENYFLTLSTIKARPLAMGSAYTSIEDDIVSASYNPATLNLYQVKKDYRLTIYLNPIAPITVYYEQFNNNQNGKNDRGTQKFFKTASLLMKGLVFTALAVLR